MVSKLDPKNKLFKPPVFEFTLSIQKKKAECWLVGGFLSDTQYNLSKYEGATYPW